MKKDRTRNLMEVEFEYNGKKESYDVWIPFEIYVNAIRQYFEDNFVSLDGTDNSIWNTFVELGCIDDFVDKDGFIDICKELYKDSKYEEEDFEDWKSDLEVE